MLEKLQPMDLHGAAEALGVHPFEVVRLMVMSGKDEGVPLGPDLVAELRSFGQIENWWDDAELPEDGEANRRVIRGVLDAMLQRELVSGKATRLDNLWRGLEAGQQEVAEQGVMILLELGHLEATAAPSGARVSVTDSGLDTVQALVSRGQAPDELAALWQG